MLVKNYPHYNKKYAVLQVIMGLSRNHTTAKNVAMSISLLRNALSDTILKSDNSSAAISDWCVLN